MKCNYEYLYDYSMCVYLLRPLLLRPLCLTRGAGGTAEPGGMSVVGRGVWWHRRLTGRVACRIVALRAAEWY